MSREKIPSPENGTEPEGGAVILVPKSGRGPDVSMIEGDGSAQAIIWPGIGARTRSMHMLKLRQGSATIPLRHESESVYYVLSGGPLVIRDLDAGAEETCPQGAMIFIEPGTAYVFSAIDYVEIVGGPCPPDESMYS